MKPEGWTEVPTPAVMQIVPGVLVAKTFAKGPVTAIFTTENHGGKIIRHVSVARRDRLPIWDEIKAARAAFFEDRHNVAQFLPPQAEYVNVHQFCLHLWAKPNGEPWI